MSKVQSLVITGYGTNSHKESAHACLLNGADKADIVHFADIASGNVKLSDYQLLIFPGGFLDGDDLGAAQAAAQRWRHLEDKGGKPLMTSLSEFIAQDKLIIGICNGFQLLVKLGILPALDKEYFTRQVSLVHNASAKYEDRWVRLKANPQSNCIFTKNVEYLDCPIRHGEGRLVALNDEILNRIEKENLIALQYADPTSGEATQEYPYNPNNSPLAIAGLTDPTGHILGLMPHPEAANHITNYPTWTRDRANNAEPKQLATVLFKNAIDYLKK